MRVPCTFTELHACGLAEVCLTLVNALVDRFTSGSLSCHLGVLTEGDGVGQYTFIYHSKSGAMGDLWKGTLTQAKVLAIAAVDEGRAERVEVYDDVNRRLFRYPRIDRHG